MTAVNIFLRPSSAILMTDGAGHDAQGGLHLRAKVYPFPYINAALACRGPFQIATAIANFLSAAVTFDEARTLLGKAQRDSFEQLRPLFALDFAGVSEAYLVGLSEGSGAFEAVVSFSEPAGSHAAFEVLRLPAFHYAPADSLDDMAQRIAERITADPAEFNPDTHGKALMLGQARSIPGTIGGFYQVTTLSKDRIETRIVERWQ